MQTVSMNFAIHSAQEYVQKISNFERITPEISNSKLFRVLFWAVDFFVTPKLKKLSSHLAESCSVLKVFVLDVQQNSECELIDPELAMRDNIESLKNILHTNRKEALKVILSLEKCGDLTAKMCREFKTIAALAAELHDEANQLQWAVAEHDASCNRRAEGFVATNQSEIDAMLARIITGA